MSIIGFINVALGITALLTILYSLARSRSDRHWHCELMIGDVLVVLAYLLTINTEWLSGQPGMEGFTSEKAWRLFGLVVLVNLLAHTIMTSRNRREDH